jgi:CubicO group peptidase (beta-lactamase class C family)
MGRNSTLTAFALWFTMCARADTIDQHVLAEMRRHHIPAISLAVVRDGKAVKVKGYGSANLELKVPTTADTVFPIASVTKQFTAAAVMLLVEEGRIALDDRIDKYVSGLPESWREITVQHLLTHTSGIKDYLNVNDFHLPSHSCADFTMAEIVREVAKLPPNSPPGERWSYSNTGYVLLGIIIENVTGKSYGQFFAERLFRPLGMSSTRRRSLTEIIANRADGYDFRDGRLQRAIHLNPTLWDNPDGGIISTASDMAKWDETLRTDKILKRSTREVMWRPTSLSHGDTAAYGFGWHISDVRGHRVVQHGGGRPGASAFLVHYIDDNLTVVTLANKGNTYLAPLTWTVAGLYEPRLLPPHDLGEAREPDPAGQRNLLAFLSDVAKGTEQSSLMTAGMRLAASRDLEGRRYTAARLEGMKSFTLLACDDVKERRLERQGEQIARICYYKMLTGEETRYYVFWLTADGRIADYTSYTV